MSILQASGIQFSDNTVLNSKYGIVPQNSVMIFFSQAAPSFWTKSLAHNNKALRVVSGTGGGFGSGGTSGPGGSPFTTIMTTRSVPGTVQTRGSVGNTTLSLAQTPSHTHNAGSSVTVRGGSPSVAGKRFGAPGPIAVTSPSGGGGAHNHPFPNSPSSVSGTADLRVQYIDVIVCNFSG